MLKRGWFLLVIGLIVGVVLGYVLAEQQTVPPVKAPVAATGMEGLPPGHPPVEQGAQATGASDANPASARQAAELEQLLAQSPNDARLMIALGNLYFDAARWGDARKWYERSLEKSAGDANVLNDPPRLQLFGPIAQLAKVVQDILEALRLGGADVCREDRTTHALHIRVKRPGLFA